MSFPEDFQVEEMYCKVKKQCSIEKRQSKVRKVGTNYIVNLKKKHALYPRRTNGLDIFIIIIYLLFFFFLIFYFDCEWLTVCKIMDSKKDKEKEKEKDKKKVKKPETMRCDYCKRDVFHCKRCGVCKKAQYCSPMCQKDDWSEVCEKAWKQKKKKVSLFSHRFLVVVF